MAENSSNLDLSSTSSADSMESELKKSKSKALGNILLEGRHGPQYFIVDLNNKYYAEENKGRYICYGVESPQIPLYHYKDVPSFLQGNPYVVSGYRAFLPFGLCMRSMFVWSNETINVWTHLIGMFTFAALTIYDNFIALPMFDGKWFDHAIVTFSLICFQFCLLCSSGFHLFSCHSEKTNKKWLSLDLSGICVGLLGCYIPGIYFAFYCHDVARTSYMTMIGFLLLLTLFMPLHPRYLTHSWNNRRLLLYCSLVGYGVIPTVHWVVLEGGFSSEAVQLFLSKVIVMYFLGMMAFFFYLSKIPERLFPGRVDFIGSSHQLWHAIVVIAFLWWHSSGASLLLFRKSAGCPSTS